MASNERCRIGEQPQYTFRDFFRLAESADGLNCDHLIFGLQWGSDYPHPESTFPRTRQILDEILAGCSEAEKAKIAGGNAARIYHLD